MKHGLGAVLFALVVAAGGCEKGQAQSSQDSPAVYQFDTPDWGGVETSLLLVKVVDNGVDNGSSTTLLFANRTHLQLMSIDPSDPLLKNDPRNYGTIYELRVGESELHVASLDDWEREDGSACTCFSPPAPSNCAV